MKSTNFFKNYYTSNYGLHFILLSLFYFFLLTSCHAQADSDKSKEASHEAIGISLFNDSINRPDIKIKVNKRYDDNGNILKYDSTYTYVYKQGSNGAFLNNDTLFKQFKNYFNKQSLNQLGMRSADVFFNDSLFQYDFFNDDYFRKRFELNENIFHDFFTQMDSLKKNYMNETYSQSIHKKK